MSTNIETAAQIRTHSPRLIAGTILLLPLLVLTAATLMYQTGMFNPSQRTNQGYLLSPVLQLSDLLPEQSQQLHGSWQLILFDDGQPNGRSYDWIYWTRQIHVALGKDMDRVQRVFISSSDEMPARLQEIGGYQTFKLTREQIDAFTHGQVHGDPVSGGYLFVADPLGNVMLYYTGEQTGQQITKDLKKLLRISNIG